MSFNERANTSMQVGVCHRDEQFRPGVTDASNRSRIPSAEQKFCGKRTTKRSILIALTLAILILLATSI